MLSFSMFLSGALSPSVQSDMRIIVYDFSNARDPLSRGLSWLNVFSKMKMSTVASAQLRCLVYVYKLNTRNADDTKRSTRLRNQTRRRVLGLLMLVLLLLVAVSARWIGPLNMYGFLFML